MPTQLQRLMGHASIHTTLKYYVGTTDARAKVEAAFAAAS
jgi:integrase